MSHFISFHPLPSGCIQVCVCARMRVWVWVRVDVGVGGCPGTATAANLLLLQKHGAIALFSPNNPKQLSHQAVCTVLRGIFFIGNSLLDGFGNETLYYNTAPNTYTKKPVLQQIVSGMVFNIQHIFSFGPLCAQHCPKDLVKLCFCQDTLSRLVFFEFVQDMQST